jgi:hypothetical protein
LFRTASIKGDEKSRKFLSRKCQTPLPSLVQINISWEFVPLDSLSPLNGNKGRVTQDGGF